MGDRRVGLMALLALAGVGCAYIGQGSPSPTGQLPNVSAAPLANATDPLASVSGDSEPSMTAVSSPSSSRPTPTATRSTPRPSQSPDTDLEASDRFWNWFYDTCFFGRITEIPSTLREMTDKSDLVVRGEITDIGIDRLEGEEVVYELVHAKVSIGEVLKGNMEHDNTDVVEVQLGLDAPSDLNGLRSLIPGHDHIWFLKSSEDVPGSYYTTSYTQISVLREIGGVVKVIQPRRIATAYSEDQFPVPLDGTSFDGLVQKVRDLSAKATSPTVFARKSPPDQHPGNRWAAC